MLKRNVKNEKSDCVSSLPISNFNVHEIQNEKNEHTHTQENSEENTSSAF